MSDTRDVLEGFYSALRQEREEETASRALRESVLERLEKADENEVLEPWVLSADRAETVEELLVETHAEAVASVPWVGFVDGVWARLEARTVSEEDDARALAPEVEPEASTVEEWLRLERDAELTRMDDRWVAFGAQLRSRLSSVPTTMEERAVDLLRAEVDDEVEALTPAFDSGFPDEVKRRLGRDSGSWFRTLYDRVRENRGRVLWSWGSGLGLLGAAGALAFMVTAADPAGSGGQGQPPLYGEVTVDTVDFEGDVMMIPEEGITVVVLSGV